MLAGQKLGILGQVHPNICQAYNLDDNVLLAELDFALMLERAKTENNTKLPKYPVTRDLAIVAGQKCYPTLKDDKGLRWTTFGKG